MVSFVPMNNSSASLDQYVNENKSYVTSIGKELGAIKANQGYFNGDEISVTNLMECLSKQNVKFYLLLKIDPI